MVNKQLIVENKQLTYENKQLIFVNKQVQSNNWRFVKYFIWSNNWIIKRLITSGTWRRKVRVMLSKVCADTSHKDRFWPLWNSDTLDCCLTATNWDITLASSFLLDVSFTLLLFRFFRFFFFFTVGGNVALVSPGSVTKDVEWSSDEDSTPNKRRGQSVRNEVFRHAQLSHWRFRKTTKVCIF